MRYQKNYAGKITKTEAVAVAEKILSDAGVPGSVYAVTRDGIEIIVGSRRHTIPAKAGMTYFEMQSPTRHCETVASEFKEAKARRNQIDLEDCIASAPA